MPGGFEPGPAALPTHSLLEPEAGWALCPGRGCRQGTLDCVLLTSSSTAHGLADAVGAQAAELLRGVVVASIGPITTTTAVERGLAVAVTVREHSVAGLPEALGAHWVQGPACEPQAPQL